VADQIDVSGLTELRETLLKSLPEALQGKASQAALTKASAPIVQSAKLKAPSRKPRGFVGPTQPDSKKGRLRASIYSFRNRESNKTYESRFIGVKGRAWYWRFIEFGRGQVEIARGSLGTPIKGFFGKAVRAFPAHPFLRPAFEENVQVALSIYQRELIPAIEKVARKAYERSTRRLRKAITGI